MYKWMFVLVVVIIAGCMSDIDRPDIDDDNGTPDNADNRDAGLQKDLSTACDSGLTPEETDSGFLETDSGTDSIPDSGTTSQSVSSRQVWKACSELTCEGKDSWVCWDWTDDCFQETVCEDGSKRSYVHCEDAPERGCPRNSIDCESYFPETDFLCVENRDRCENITLCDWKGVGYKYYEVVACKV